MSEEYEKVAMEAARREAMEDGWRRFRLPGEPPRAGTPVEKRMIDTAEEYVKCVFSKKLRDRNEASQTVQSASESKQRMLHNQLAIMLFGESRTDMDYKLATKIQDFAVSLAYPGFSPDQVYEMVNEETED